MKRIWIFIVIAGIGLVAMSAYHFLNRPGRGDIAYAFILNDLSGKPVSLADYRGKAVLLAFWASWCVYCRSEFPLLIQLNKDYNEKGLEVLIISEDTLKDEYALKSFLKEHPSDLKILLDIDALIADKFQSFGVPEFLLINRSGVIMRRLSGPVNWASDKAKGYIGEILAGPP